MKSKFEKVFKPNKCHYQSCNGQTQMIEKYSNALKSGRPHGTFTYFWNGFFDGIFFLFLYTFYGLGNFILQARLFHPCSSRCFCGKFRLVSLK